MFFGLVEFTFPFFWFWLFFSGDHQLLPDPPPPERPPPKDEELDPLLPPELDDPLVPPKLERPWVPRDSSSNCGNIFVFFTEASQILQE